ncbi:MAG: CAP domain-containing protein [Dehalococcoidia bacterium]
MTFRFRFFAAAAAFAVLALTAAGTGSLRPAAVDAAGDCTVADNTFDAEERRFAELINQYRAQNSLPALTVSVNLNRESSWHAKDMADKNYFSHTDSLGRSPEVRGADCGTLPKIGENIAAGTTRDTAQEAFDAWKASDGHNKNMLNSGYKQIGIARYYRSGSTYGWYWVTDFSLNTDGTNALTGGSTIPPATATPTKTTTSVPATATKTPTKTATPATATAATIVSPAPGSKLTSTSATFTWNKVAGATKYQIYVGTSPGAYNLKNVATTGSSISVSGLPRGSVKLYVRLWTQVNGNWKYVDYTYTSAP